MIAIIGSSFSIGAKKRRYRAGYSYDVAVSTYGLSGFDVRTTNRTHESYPDVHGEVQRDDLRLVMGLEPEIIVTSSTDLEGHVA